MLSSRQEELFDIQIGNTLLFIHTDPKIILCLLRNNIDLTSRNILNDTAYQYHLKRKNYYICD